MTQAVAQAPVWFLMFLIFAMGGLVTLLLGGFLWSIRGILTRIEKNLESLFTKHDNHETRLSHLEATCKAQHSD